jgi:enoyl-[acyl-carrier-protein] reductase (NADH)
MKEDHLYNSLREKLLDTDFASNSLVDKAKALKRIDQKYDVKVNTIINYLSEKLGHGDGITYALINAAHEDTINKVLSNFNNQDFLKFLQEHKNSFSETDLNNDFFDPKVAYLASSITSELSGVTECDSADSQ